MIAFQLKAKCFHAIFLVPWIKKKHIRPWVCRNTNFRYMLRNCAFKYRLWWKKLPSSGRKFGTLKVFKQVTLIRIYFLERLAQHQLSEVVPNVLGIVFDKITGNHNNNFSTTIYLWHRKKWIRLRTINCFETGITESLSKWL